MEWVVNSLIKTFSTLDLVHLDLFLCIFLWFSNTSVLQIKACNVFLLRGCCPPYLHHLYWLHMGRSELLNFEWLLPSCWVVICLAHSISLSITSAVKNIELWGMGMSITFNIIGKMNDSPLKHLTSQWDANGTLIHNSYNLQVIPQCDKSW